MPPAAQKPAPSGILQFKIEAVLRSPVQCPCRLEHAFLPKPIRQLFQTSAVFRAYARSLRDLRVEPGRHHPSQSINIVELRVTPFQLSGKCEQGMAKCEYEVKNQAEPLEAMAHRVKTQIKHLVGQHRGAEWAHLGTERGVSEPR